MAVDERSTRLYQRQVLPLQQLMQARAGEKTANLARGIRTSTLQAGNTPWRVMRPLPTIDIAPN